MDGAPTGVPSAAPLGPPPASTSMHVSAVDVAASSPFSQAQAVKGQASQPLGGCAAPSSKPDAAGAEQADSKAASPPDGSEEELAPGLLPKLPWRENPLITKVL